MTEILRITELVEDLAAPRWEEYPKIPGFRLLLRLPDIPEAARIMGRAMLAGMRQDGLRAEVPPLPETLEGKEDEDKVAARALAATDWVEHQLQLTLFAVADWQGLKVKHLKQLLPRQKIKLEGADGEAELTFCPENLEFLVRRAPDFSNWLSTYVRDWYRQVTQQEEKDNENLPPTPDTSQTPSA